MSLTLLLILVNVLVSYAAFRDPGLFDRLSHRPWEVARHRQFDRWLTSGFVHADWLHLAINMFVLWQFGTAVEEAFIQGAGLLTGKVRFLTVYLLTLTASNIPCYLKQNRNPGYTSVGASGAVSGILFAYVLFYPLNVLYLYGIIPLYGIVAALAYLAYSSWASGRSNDNINHDAHFYGALAGILLTLLFFPGVALHFVSVIREGIGL